jgi:hypothetical protein
MSPTIAVPQDDLAKKMNVFWTDFNENSKGKTIRQILLEPIPVKIGSKMYTAQLVTKNPDGTWVPAPGYSLGYYKCRFCLKDIMGGNFIQLKGNGVDLRFGDHDIHQLKEHYSQKLESEAERIGQLREIFFDADKKIGTPEEILSQDVSTIYSLEDMTTKTYQKEYDFHGNPVTIIFNRIWWGKAPSCGVDIFGVAVVQMNRDAALEKLIKEIIEVPSSATMTGLSPIVNQIHFYPR